RSVLPHAQAGTPSPLSTAPEQTGITPAVVAQPVSAEQEEPDAQAMQSLVDEQAQLLAEAARWRQDADLPAPTVAPVPLETQMSTAPSAPAPVAMASQAADEDAGSAGVAKLLQLRNRLRSQRLSDAGEPRLSAHAGQVANPALRPEPTSAPAVASSVVAPAQAQPPSMTEAQPMPEAQPPSLSSTMPSAAQPAQAAQEPPPWDDIPLSAYEDLVSLGEPESAAPASPPQAPLPPKPEGQRQAPMSPASLSPPPAKPFMSAPTQAPTAVIEADGEAGELWQSDDLLRDCGDPWAELMVAAGIRGRLRQLCLNASCDMSGQPWQLRLAAEHRHLVSERAIAELASQLGMHLGQPVQLQVSLEGPEGPTPWQIERQRYALLQQAAEHSLASDPHVQFMIERFGAELDADSIQPLKSC
ncbi:MAG: hypothetical protein LRY38_06990, partial [Aeromonadaceae bacterium]|nr:hypothetical protein [Aeromonadaceae bacterium]